MIYELPEPYLTATHVHFYEKKVEESRGGGFVRLTGDLGRFDGDGFERLSEMPRGSIVRHIKDREFTEFLEFVDTQRAGAPTEGRADFRDEDYAQWFDSHGWSDERVSWKSSKPKTREPRRTIPVRTEPSSRSETLEDLDLWELFTLLLKKLKRRLFFWR